jgi:nuclear-control-of-ATPase protein 2
VDSQLDRLQLAAIKSTTSSPVLSYRTITGQADAAQAPPDFHSSPRINELQALIKAFSTTSSSKVLLSPWRISLLLEQAELSEDEATAHSKTPYEKELEWLLVSKATIHVYGALMNTLLEQTIPISNDIYYWDEVLGSYTYTALYTVQTSPLRFWDWSKDIYHDASRRLDKVRRHPEGVISSPKEVKQGLRESWKEFYGLVRESIRERSMVDIQARVLSPIAKARSEAKRKQAGLKRLREMSASGLGVLMDEALTFDIHEDSNGNVKIHEIDPHEWKGVVEKSVALMDSVLNNVTALEAGVAEFEDVVFSNVENDPEVSSRSSADSGNRPVKLAKRLSNILNHQLPNHVLEQGLLKAHYGRPSRATRYWLPATALLLSSTTILRILVNRKADILQWIREFGATVQDFWLNWVVEPSKKVVKTIRHDEESEVAIMSKESLKGDRDSLERMVVDFALDRPEAAGMGNSISDAQIDHIKAKVKEGDLTPVLRAYEKDLRQPFVGTIRGDLVRTLLIQVQKTKVDVEVAMSGIDTLLKSQELVFGFIGLTPGILVSVGVVRYINGIFGSRKGMRHQRKSGQTVRVLRNIDRILTMSVPLQSGVLSYKDHGLLLCEIHVLRSKAAKLFPGEIQREFLEDVNELADISIGVERQRKVVERIRWAYAKWL